jgi:carbon-monoxide dehydrogenase small subunit
MTAKALLEKNSSPSVDEIKRGLSGNLCRCTGYVKIVEAVGKASRTIRETAGGGGA